MLTVEIKGFASLNEFSFSLPIFVLAWLIGQGARWWENSNVLLREHLDDLSATEQARAASAVADERARIARELHDVVAHSISVMVVQAGSARLRLRTDPDASETALHSVEQTGRQALAEMRRMLGVLRADDQGLSLGPQPSLRGLDQLLDQMRGAGLTVEASSTPRGRRARAGSTAATGSSACASVRRCSGVRSRPSRGQAAGTRCAPPSRCRPRARHDPRAHRR